MIIERIGLASNPREVRSFEAAEARATEALGDRRVWCVASDEAGLQRARSLLSALARGERVELRGDEAELGVVGPGDIVLLHDQGAAAVGEAVRERGAHAVFDAGTVPRPSRAAHAYLMAWLPVEVPEVREERIAAAIPAAGVVSAKSVAGGPAGRRLAWYSLLADVVSSDVGETVGGTFHARPTVAAR